MITDIFCFNLHRLGLGIVVNTMKTNLQSGLPWRATFLMWSKNQTTSMKFLDEMFLTNKQETTEYSKSFHRKNTKVIANH